MRVSLCLALLLACSCAIAQEDPRAWRRGGTLHDATLYEWTQAKPENRLATAADFILSKVIDKQRLPDEASLRSMAAIFDRRVLYEAKQRSENVQRAQKAQPFLEQDAKWLRTELPQFLWDYRAFVDSWSNRDWRLGKTHIDGTLGDYLKAPPEEKLTTAADFVLEKTYGVCAWTTEEDLKTVAAIWVKIIDYRVGKISPDSDFAQKNIRDALDPVLTIKPFLKWIQDNDADMTKLAREWAKPRTASEKPPAPLKTDGFRDWTAADGQRSFEAKFLQYRSGRVIFIKRDGSRVGLSISQLSKDDQRIVRELAAKSEE